MGEREIRAKYGGHLPKAINRAIRAEVAGGNEALDRLTHLAGAARQSHWHDAKGRPTPEAEAYYRHQREVVARMEAEVRRRWGVPPDAGPRDDGEGPGKRRASRAGGSGTRRGQRSAGSGARSRKHQVTRGQAKRPRRGG
jgi:hypothetical protein